MNRKNWTLIRYILFNIPALFLLILVLLLIRKYIALEAWAMGLIIFLWVVKDIILYPLVRKAYEGGKGQAEDDMQGLTGVALERLAPQGFIKIRGERWQAREESGNRVVEAGTTVKVIRRQGLKLFVVPHNKEE